MRPLSVVARLLAATCVLVVGCAPPGPDPGAQAAPPATAAPPEKEVSCVGSDNPVDVAACPRLTAAGCASGRAAPTNELCKRLYVDLTGAAPTPDEIATTCANRSPREIATTLMATPSYVKHAQELWGEILGYDPAQVDGQWLADADDVVAGLVRGDMGYDAFTKRILGRPVFGVGARLPRSDVLHDDDRFYPQVARRAIKVFLGRDPVAGEDLALAKLFRMWKKDIVVLNGDYGRAEPFLDPAACPCASTVFGVSTSIVLPAASFDAAAPELEKIGSLFVTQQAYWTQAADLALAMYLGWWKTTPALDASMLPDVDLAIGEKLRASPARSWRDMVLDIVSSALYVRSNRVAAGAPDDQPVFCAGPFRLLRPEAYVASLGKLLDLRVGRCDHRTYERRGAFYPDGSEGTFFPDKLREDEPSDVSTLGVSDYHWVASTGMGGCSAGAARSEEPNMPLVFGAAPVADDLCTASSTLLPPGVGASDVSDGAVRAIADRLSTLLLGRLPTDAERAAMAADASSCSACDAKRIAADMCTAMARSTDAMTY